MRLVLALLVGVALVAPAQSQTLDETFEIMSRALAEMQLALEPHDHSQLGDVGEFYSKWMRPKGNFSGIQHRRVSCCNRTDCDVVTGVSIIKGKMWVTVRREPGRWYPVDPAIIEANQEDPRESPDGLSHACIIGGQVACFVEGGGI